MVPSGLLYVSQLVGQRSEMKAETDFQPITRATSGINAYLGWKMIQKMRNKRSNINRNGKPSVMKLIGQNLTGEINGARQASKKNSTVTAFTIRKNPFVKSRKNFNKQIVWPL
jgi:hypothetical protein